MTRSTVPLVRIVDDESIVRDSLSLFLSMANYEVVTYQSARDFLEKDRPDRAGCLILDVRMPQMSGIELFDRLRGAGSILPVIFLSAHGDIEMAVEAVKRGAIDFLVKPPKPEKLLELVEKAIQIHQHSLCRREEAQDLLRNWEQLTEAQTRVAFLVAKGLSNAVIAEVLGISVRTVKAHRAKVYEKLEAENAVEVLEFLQAANLLESQP